MVRRGPLVVVVVVVVLVLVAIMPRLARAEASRVVLIREPDAGDVVARAETRVAAELRAAGFGVDERVEPAPPADGDESAEGPRGAFATVILTRVRGGASTEIRVLDHVTRKTVVRRIDATDGGERLLALRVVELMRASLVEPLVVEESSPPLSTAPPPKDVQAWTAEATHPLPPPPPRRDGLALGAGVTALWGGPDIGFGFAPSLEVSFGFAEILRARLVAIGPAFGARVEASQGSATVRQELALLELAVDPAAAGARFRPFVAVGAGPYHLDAQGDARPPYVGVEDDVWAFIASAGAGLRMKLGPGACLTLAARALVAAPRPVVAFGSDVVAAAGRPSIALTFGVEALP